MRALKNLVLFSAAGLFLLWVILHLSDLMAGPGGASRFILGGVFCVLILTRWKARDPDHESGPHALRGVALAAAGVGGTILLLTGRILDVGQFVWLGFILVLCAAMIWSLDRRFTRDVILATFVLYWVHPLPGQVFVPLQFLMQKLSVKGAEFMLQCANVYSWADHVVLHTAWSQFLVPESCSGMSTGVTVLICALGFGVLVRFRWYETAGLALLGVLQTLALNAFRIMIMALWAPRMAKEWAEGFLHDTLGMLLLLGIVLVHLEGIWWRLWRIRRKKVLEGRETGEVEQPLRGLPLPRFWELILRWFVWGVAALLVLGLVAFGVYKRRTSHRLAMIAGVVEGLIDTDAVAAEKAARTVLAINRDDRQMRGHLVRILLVRQKPGKALEELARIEGQLNVQESAMKAWALMVLDRHGEALAVVDSLPPQTAQWPQVAVVRAECAAANDRPAEVSRNVVIASKWHGVMGRVRRLYPYLASREQWWAIAASDNRDVPFEVLSESLLVIHAYIKTGDWTGAADAMRRALKKWEHDPSLLDDLFWLAERQPGSDWEARFADVLTRNIARIGSDRIATHISQAFRLDRPDLAWLAFRRLQALDAADPALHEMVARFARDWFTFRRHGLGLPSGNAFATIDLRGVFRATRDLYPLKKLWDLVPMGDELSRGDLVALQRLHSHACLKEIDRRRKAGSLSGRMQMSYPVILAMAGRYEEAQAALESLLKTRPDRRFDILLQQAVFYDQQGKWQESYEALRACRMESGGAGVSAELMMINALLNMNLGVCALEWIERAQKLYPDHPSLQVALASVWDVFGFKEDALFVVQDQDFVGRPQAIVQLLYDTGRLLEAERKAKAYGVSFSRRAGKQLKAGVRPAETALQVVSGKPMTRDEMQARVAEIKNGLNNAGGSPFLKKLLELELAWYEKQGDGAVSNPKQWAAVGRDHIEQGGALHRLATLLLRNGKHDQARAVTRQALELLPSSQILRRMLVSLAEDNEKASVVEKACAACPDDPELWLADLVVRARLLRTQLTESANGQTGDDSASSQFSFQLSSLSPQQAKLRAELATWYKTELQRAVAERRFSVATMVRASDFLLRAGFVEAAGIGARDAVERAQGFLPAYILGLRCAQAAGDMSWAMTCALAGTENTVDPGQFYKVIVDIKSATSSSDAELIAALEYLQRHYVGETRWVEHLSHLYFEKGDTRRTLQLLAPVVDKSLKTTRSQSLLLAAEAARQEGALDRSIQVLESAYGMYPDRLSVLNNLVYTLQQSPKHLARARELLPILLKKGKGSPVVLDTAAMVAMKSGDLELASRYMEMALKSMDAGSYSATETRLNAARILLRQGRLDEARAQLEKIQRQPKLSPLVELSSRELLGEIERQEEAGGQ